MILSGQAIRERLGSDIVIDPFDESQLNPNSYNLTLHDELMVYEEVMLDMAKANRVRRIEIPEDGLVLSPNQLYLGRTAERTVTHNLVPQIEGRSSRRPAGAVRARHGRLRRRRLLRLLDAGDVRRPPGADLSRACRSARSSITRSAAQIEEYASKYQHNRDIQPSLLFEELAAHRKHDPQLPLNFGWSARTDKRCRKA